ncbi:hypothetical protein H1R20_g12052, partial [Candolleomyces eurysporus]
MFQSTRQRQNLADEDAPPMTSKSALDGSQFSKRHTKAPSVATLSQQQPLSIIVFGYPADKFSITVEYFKSLGDSTEADPNTEIQNCFRIGYKDPADALRAVRKNGEVLGGSWMIGVKWADQTQAEALLGQPSARGNTFGDREAMVVDEPTHSAVSSPTNFSSNTPSFGTPLRLEPSTSAFRRPGAPASKPATPQGFAGWSTPAANGGGGGGSASPAAAQPSPSKSMIGQVSDLIFGW